MEILNALPTTSYIKYLAVSAYSSGTARIKSSCNLIGKCFEIGNKPYRQTLYTMRAKHINKIEKYHGC